jgi:hypothetical protein
MPRLAPPGQTVSVRCAELLRSAATKQLPPPCGSWSRGKELLAAAITRRLVERFIRSAPARGGPARVLGALSAREVEVLRLPALGCSKAEIDELVVSRATGKIHKSPRSLASAAYATGCRPLLPPTRAASFGPPNRAHPSRSVGVGAPARDDLQRWMAPAGSLPEAFQTRRIAELISALGGFRSTPWEQEQHVL